MTSAINLLSNGDLKNQKVSIFKGLRALISTFCLFPLNRRRGFIGNIIDNPVNAFDFVGDAGGNFLVSRDKCFLVDWDGVLLAPPERDAWVMGFREWASSLSDLKASSARKIIKA